MANPMATYGRHAIPPTSVTDPIIPPPIKVGGCVGFATPMLWAIPPTSVPDPIPSFPPPKDGVRPDPHPIKDGMGSARDGIGTAIHGMGNPPHLLPSKPKLLSATSSLRPRSHPIIPPIFGGVRWDRHGHHSPPSFPPHL